MTSSPRHFIVIILAVAAITGCGLSDPGFDTLHPRLTNDCSRHIDGSSYAIRGDALGANDISAGAFRMGGSPPFVEVIYWVKNGDALRLDSLKFTAVSVSGEPIVATKASILRNPLVPDEVPRLEDLTIDLKGDGSVRGRDRYPTDKHTIYRVVLTFDQALPEQFDVHLPDVWLDGKKYPVRIFGFRDFADKGLGLCE